MYVFVMGRENGCYTESGSWNQTIGNQKSKAASLCVCVLGFFLCVSGPQTNKWNYKNKIM